uniref:NADH dehydrogenase subunit 6 n=1 Tax=Glyphocrangon regalis TaxID=1616678 RepID=UPI0023D89D72|nr:NADH dehydrogenase subunit 6 [Glyphocrangon regalis]WDD39098.1 NADH dehydrogenase subunit 6 [Glyphocrangon regalis]
MICLSYIFMQLTHPLAMGMTLLIQTILVCLTTSTCSKSMWFSYILFLIFLGAMLILFIYVASLASNEPFSMSPFNFMLLIIMMMSLLMSILMDPMLTKIKLTLEKSYMLKDSFMSTPQFNLSMIFNLPCFFLTLFIIMYLLLTLIVVVKITSNFSGPLRLSYDNTP